jgi:DNA repair exonuclease SbcCD ATPase subunit
MKKAFEDNLPRLKPRLRLQTDQAESATTSGDSRGGEQHRAGPSVDVKAAVEAALRARPDEARSSSSFEPPPQAEERSQQRRKLRQRLAELGREPRPLDPESPRAAEALLSTAEGLAGELADARARCDRLETDLLRARSDLDRALAEVTQRRRQEEDSARRLDESRALLGTFETELSMLEEERDEVLFEVRGLRARDTERQDVLQTMSGELDRVRKQLSESQAEQAELVHELEAEEERSASLSRDLARLEAERTRWAEQISEATGARGALADSRRTLEEVHRVLALARSRPPRR